MTRMNLRKAKSMKDALPLWLVGKATPLTEKAFEVATPADKKANKKTEK